MMSGRGKNGKMKVDTKNIPADWMKGGRIIKNVDKMICKFCNDPKCKTVRVYGPTGKNRTKRQCQV